MNVETNQSEPSSISLGERFRQAREALNLSIDDVVAKTNLNSSILEKLETNGFDGQSVPAIFVNGYIRSYAQFLRLPEEAWSNLNIGKNIEHDLSKGARTGAVTNPYSSLGRWVGYLTVLVVLVMAGMTALWWWENYQQSNTERDNLVQNYVSKEEKNTQAPAPSTAEPVKPAEAASVVANQTTDVSADLAKAEMIVASPAPVTSTTESSTVSSTSATPQTVPVGAVEPTAQPIIDKVAQETQPAVVGAGDLYIEVTGESCWITVRDANRKPLAQKEYKQGETLSFSNAGPYSLTIGAPGNVKITYKGELYPLKVDGRVARFKLD